MILFECYYVWNLKQNKQTTQISSLVFFYHCDLIFYDFTNTLIFGKNSSRVSVLLTLNEPVCSLRSPCITVSILRN